MVGQPETGLAVVAGFELLWKRALTGSGVFEGNYSSVPGPLHRPTVACGS